MDVNQFSKRLRKMLEIRSITQKDLSIECDIPSSVINRYCQGRYFPKYDNLIKICKVLKCNPAYLRGDTDDYEDFDGLKLVNFVRSSNPTIEQLDGLSIEERHCAFIYSEVQGLSLEQLEKIEDYIKFIKSK